MTIYYVSNAAVNGTYVVGNDANDGLTPATAKLTINSGGGTGAIFAASNGDTIYVNPGGVTYSENTPVGLNYLQINKQLTIQTDPAYVASAGKATITSPAGGTRTINLNQANITLIDLRIDNASQTRNCVFCQSFSGHTLTRCDFLNLGANAIAVTAQNNNAYNITVEKCTLLAANGNAAGTKLHQITGTLGGMSTVIRGCTTDTTGGLFAAASGFGGTVTIGASSDGTRNKVSNASIGIQNLSTNVTTTFDIQNTDFIACPVGIGDGGTTSAVLASLIVKYCKFSGLDSSLTAVDISFFSTIAAGEIAYNSFEGSHTNIGWSSAAIQVVLSHDNYILTPSMGTGRSNINCTRGGPGLEFYNNKITSNSDSRLIAIGGEGYSATVTNSGGALAGDQDLGQGAGNAWLGQTFTYPAAATALFERYLGAFDVGLKKVGSPTGNIRAYLYTDVAGSPGALVATSAETFLSSYLTGAYQQVRFWFESRIQLSYSTAYWIVLKFENQTIDGANYVQVQRYTAGTVAKTSSDGLSWSAAANALGFIVSQSKLTMTQPKVYDNELRATHASAITHCIIVNATDGGLVYRNQIYGGAIGVLFKLVDGSVQDALAYNNLISFSNTGDGAAIHDKGSNAAQYYNNSIYITAGNNRALFLEGDWLPGYVNGKPTVDPVGRNNVFYSNASSGYVIALGNENALGYTVISPILGQNTYYKGGAAVFAGVNLGVAATYTDYATFPLYQAAVAPSDSTSQYADPLIRNSVPTQDIDFIPEIHSPVLGFGMFIGNAPTDDFFLKVRPTPPSGGAAEVPRRLHTNTRDTVATREVIM